MQFRYLQFAPPKQRCPYLEEDKKYKLWNLMLCFLQFCLTLGTHIVHLTAELWIMPEYGQGNNLKIKGCPKSRNKCLDRGAKSSSTHIRHAGVHVQLVLSELLGRYGL